MEPADFDLYPAAEALYDQIAAMFPDGRQVNRTVGVAIAWKYLRDVRHEHDTVRDLPAWLRSP